MFCFVLFFLFPIKYNRRGVFGDVLFYYPYLLSLALKKIIKKRFFKLNMINNILLNLSSLYFFGFPRIVIQYAYISSTILISYKNTSLLENKSTNELITYLYENTYYETIDKIEIFLKYPI
jgi:hypothetical protein